MGTDPLSGYFLYCFHTAAVRFVRIRCAERSRDRMRGVPFYMGRQMEQFFFAHFLRMGGSHLEYPFGQGTGLIKNHRFNLGERFQIVRSFHKDARLARAADAGEETQGNTDNQRAGTGNNEERKRL